MKLLKLDQVTGNEILARAIMTEDYHELLSEGTVMKHEYLKKLRNLGITEIYVKDDILDPQAISILREDVNLQCKEKVRNIISRHTYRRSKEMIEISATTDCIINDILIEDDVIEQVYDIKERSADLYEHCLNTCALSVLIAVKMNLDKEVVHDIGVGCLLHDLGLRYVTLEFENISTSEMSERNLEEYKKHPVYGYTAVKNEKWLSKTSKEIILCHHEHINGSGYPLHATELSLATRIAAVCDFFDESICGIGCERLKVYEVVEYLKSFKSIYYDEEVVDQLLDFTAVYPSGSKVLTNEGETAIVIRQNKQFPERPVLQIIMDENGTIQETILVKDLLQYTNVFIEKVIN